MYLTDTETTQLSRIIAKNGLNYRAATQLSAYFKHLETHRGIKFLISYMKDVKSRVLHGDLGNISGHGKFFKRLVSKGREGKRMALNICALHGRWEAPPAKRSDFVKFARAVAVEPVKSNLILNFSTGQIQQLRDAINFARFSYSPLTSNKTHILKSNTKSRGMVDLQSEIIAMTDAGQIFIEFKDYIYHVFGVTSMAPLYLECEALRVQKTGHSNVGRVVCLTKDRSYKYRFIANLSKGWQVMISPVVYTFKEFLRRQEMSALNDQFGAVLWMIDELKKGKTITSVDLTQATDFIPRYLLEEALTSILPAISSLPRSSMFIQSFLLDCRLNDSSYWTPFDNIEVKYGTGQAMGRWTSKYLLDITMILLAQSVGGSSKNCRINGDDIFFSDTTVGMDFLRLMDQHRIPVSINKTYIDADFGEFSGVIADKFGPWDVFKASNFNVRKDPFGPLRKYGPRGRDLLPKKYRDIIWAVASLPPPYGLEKIRAASGNVYDGFEISVRAKKFAVPNWEKRWVEQAFASYKLQYLKERTQRLFRLMGNKNISKAVQNEVYQRFLICMKQLSTFQERLPYLKGTREHFREPNMRLTLFADNLNAYSIKTSDGWKIVGYGDEAFDHLRREATKRYSHTIDRDEVGLKSKSTPPPLQWVVRTYKKILGFINQFF